MKPETGQKFAYLICFLVISLAVTGYFVGMQSPMNPGQPPSFGGQPSVPGLVEHARIDAAHASHQTAGVIPATHYAGMASATNARRDFFKTSLTNLKTEFDPLAEVKIIPEQKTFALAMREQNRAYNGAPPTVPHPIDQMSAQACVVCHANGTKTKTLRIPRMSHQFLINCTQCHVENTPRHMPASLFRENSFVGLPAPTGGPRAYEGAPPQIPHSTWMRVECMSCHGFTGLQGIRTTHPWRQNCQQCHAPSSQLDQVLINPQPNFLPAPEIE